MKFCVAILAGGKGKRYSNIIPKQYIEFNNDLIINYSIKKFCDLNEIEKVFIAVNFTDFNKFKKKIYKNKKIVFIKSGLERKDTVYNVLYKIRNYNFNKILIHDAARPFISTELIKKVISYSKKNDAVIPCINTYNTVIFNNEIVNRKKIFLAQTPQAFTFEKIFYLHNKYRNVYFSDDSSLFYKENMPVKKITGNKSNIKITSKDDLNNFSLLKINYGIGYDIHQLAKNYKLYLGGVKIPFHLGTVGHSDGDPVIHSLIDSLLGTKALGDIGSLFPNDQKYKKKKSTFFLKKVLILLNNENIKINNIDINIIIEKPNLSKFKKLIANNLSRICKIPKNKISVKAKTADRLGNIGKSKSVACEVISSVTYQ